MGLFCLKRVANWRRIDPAWLPCAALRSIHQPVRLLRPEPELAHLAVEQSTPFAWVRLLDHNVPFLLVWWHSFLKGAGEIQMYSFNGESWLETETAGPQTTNVRKVSQTTYHVLLQIPIVT